jgi:K+-sensing histidine kinase KdpD
MPFRRPAEVQTPESRRHWVELTSELAFLRELAQSTPATVEGPRPTSDLRKRLEAAVGLARGTPLESTLTKILSELPSFDALISDLADMELLRSGHYPFDWVSLDLGEVLRRVAGFLGPQAGKRHVRLELEGDDAPALVRADARALGRVLFNATAHLLLRARPDSVVQLRLRVVGASAKVELSGSGLMTTAAELRRTFDEFDLRDFTTMDQRPGRRSTLYLCRLLLEAEDGQLNVAPNEPADGAILTLTLPTVRASADATSE